MVKRKLFSSAAAVIVSSAMILLLILEEQATSAALQALSATAELVIPTLFPYMVISSLIISLDLLEAFYSLIPTEKLFRLPRCTASVILCGIICGFPVGASGTAILCKNGRIDRKQAAVLPAISSHASPAFLVGAVGGSWGCPSFGVFLYAMQAIYAIAAGAVTARICLPVCPVSEDLSSPQNKPDLAKALCGGIRDASLSCLAITGYIVFFRVATVLASSVMPFFAPVFNAIFEFSGGALYGAQIGGTAGAALTGFAVGFSGLAVMMQCSSFISGEEIPMGAYVSLKAAEGVFLALCAAVFCRVTGLTPDSPAFSPAADFSVYRTIWIFSAVIALFLITSLCRKRNYFTHGY